MREALAAATAVQSALLCLGSHAPRGLHKKGDALRSAVRKTTRDPWPTPTPRLRTNPNPNPDPDPNPNPSPSPSPSPNANQVRKMETLLYELSLVERSGRVREAPLEVPGEPYRASGDGGGEMEPV